MITMIPVIALLLIVHYGLSRSEGKFVSRLASWMQATTSLAEALTVIVNMSLQGRTPWTLGL